VFKVQPLSIQFHGDVAIAHNNFQETLRDAEHQLSDLEPEHTTPVFSFWHYLVYLEFA
jgi:hypothetical protein